MKKYGSSQNNFNVLQKYLRKSLKNFKNYKKLQKSFKKIQKLQKIKKKCEKLQNSVKILQIRLLKNLCFLKKLLETALVNETEYL